MNPLWTLLAACVLAGPARADYLNDGKVSASALRQELAQEPTYGKYLADRFELVLGKANPPLSSNSQLTPDQLKDAIARFYGQIRNDQREAENGASSDVDREIASGKTAFMGQAALRLRTRAQGWSEAIRRESEAAKERTSAAQDPPATSPDPRVENPTVPAVTPDPRRTTPAPDPRADSGPRSDPLDSSGGYEANFGGDSGGSAGGGSSGAPLRQGLAAGLSGAESTVARAAGQGAALKQSLVSDDGLAGPAGPGGQLGGLAPGRAAPAPGGGGSAAGPAPLNLADPRSPQDLALAASGAFRESARDLGLRVGSGPDGRASLLGPSGAPASPAEIERFRERIASEPAALTQFPGLFNPSAGGLTRSQFGELKSDFKEKPELRDKEFKDVAMTAKERDFVRSKSCEKASGDCNESAEKSYKKDEFVPPSELAAIWKKARASYREASAQARRAREALSGSRLSAGGIMDRLRSLFGSGSGGSAGEPSGVASSRGSSPRASLGSQEPVRASAVGVPSAGPARGPLDATVPSSAAGAPSDGRAFVPERPWPPWWLWLLIATLGGAGLWLARRS